MLVFFRGQGAWWVENSNGIELAIQYRMEQKAIWSQIRGEYVEIEQLLLPRIFGIFRISEEDESIYRYTRNLDHVNLLLPCKHPDSHFQKMVKLGKLSASDFLNCFFDIQKIKQIGELQWDDNAYFLTTIDEDTPQDKSIGSATNPLKINKLNRKQTQTEPQDILQGEISIDEINQYPELKQHREFNQLLMNQKRLDSLQEFISWLEIQTQKDNIDFDKLNLDCTKEQLFDHIKCWEQSRIIKKSNRIWNVKGWESCKGLWSSQARKDICGIADDRRGKKKTESAYKKIIY